MVRFSQFPAQGKGGHLPETTLPSAGHLRPSQLGKASGELTFFKNKVYEIIHEICIKGEVRLLQLQSLSLSGAKVRGQKCTWNYRDGEGHTGSLGLESGSGWTLLCWYQLCHLGQVVNPSELQFLICEM